MQIVRSVWGHPVSQVLRFLVGLLLLMRDLRGLWDDVFAAFQQGAPSPVLSLLTYLSEHWIGLVGLVILLTLVPWPRIIPARNSQNTTGRKTVTTQQQVTGQRFENSTIPLDGLRYSGCHFKNCTFRWDGGAWGGWDAACVFETPARFETTFSVAIETVDMLKALGLLGDPAFAQSWGTRTMVAQPKTPSSVTVDPHPENEREQKVAPLITQRAEGAKLRERVRTLGEQETTSWRRVVEEWDERTRALIREGSSEDAAYFYKEVAGEPVLVETLYPGVKIHDSPQRKKMSELHEQLRRLDEIIVKWRYE
jgi:hypothetical protein